MDAKPTLITGAQCKMARVGLGWGVRDLAEAARVSTNTVTRLERGDALHERTIISIRHALEAGGAIFLDPEPNTGPGVRLRDSGT